MYDVCVCMYSVSESCEGQYNYVCWGGAVTEVGVDVLTGETRVDRVDILYDCGDRWAEESCVGGGESVWVGDRCMGGVPALFINYEWYNKMKGQVSVHFCQKGL